MVRSSNPEMDEDSPGHRSFLKIPCWECPECRKIVARGSGIVQGAEQSKDCKQSCFEGTWWEALVDVMSTRTKSKVHFQAAASLRRSIAECSHWKRQACHPKPCSPGNVLVRVRGSCLLTCNPLYVQPYTLDWRSRNIRHAAIAGLFPFASEFELEPFHAPAIPPKHKSARTKTSLGSKHPHSTQQHPQEERCMLNFELCGKQRESSGLVWF